MEQLAKVSKALAAAAAAGTAAVGQALAGDQAISPVEWLIVAGALVGGFVATYAAPRNRDA